MNAFTVTHWSGTKLRHLIRFGASFWYSLTQNVKRKRTTLAMQLLICFFFCLNLFNHGLSPANIPNMMVNIKFLVVFSSWQYTSSSFSLLERRTIPMSYTENSFRSYCCGRFALHLCETPSSAFSISNFYIYSHILRLSRFFALRACERLNELHLPRTIFYCFLFHRYGASVYALSWMKCTHNIEHCCGQLCAYKISVLEIPCIDYGKKYEILWKIHSFPCEAHSRCPVVVDKTICDSMRIRKVWFFFCTRI